MSIQIGDAVRYIPFGEYVTLRFSSVRMPGREGAGPVDTNFMVNRECRRVKTDGLYGWKWEIADISRYEYASTESIDQDILDDIGSDLSQVKIIEEK